MACTNSDSVTSVNSRYDNKTIGLQLSVLYGGGYASVLQCARQWPGKSGRVRCWRPHSVIWACVYTASSGP